MIIWPAQQGFAPFYKNIHTDKKTMVDLQFVRFDRLSAQETLACVIHLRGCCGNCPGKTRPSLGPRLEVKLGCHLEPNPPDPARMFQPPRQKGSLFSVLPQPLGRLLHSTLGPGVRYAPAHLTQQTVSASICSGAPLSLS